VSEAAQRPNPGRQAILQALERHEVRFVVIGGAASQTRGWAGQTDDVDVTPARDHDNLTRLAAALTELQAGFRVDAERYPDGFQPPGGLDARTFKQQVSIALQTPHGSVDIALLPDGFPRGYDDLHPNADVLTVALTQTQAPVAAARDILHSKRLAGRQKDLDVLPELETDFRAAGSLPVTDATQAAQLASRGQAQPPPGGHHCSS